MAEEKTYKTIKTRVQNKHDTEANWSSATFSPLPGEIIIYEKDGDGTNGTHAMPRVKIGDGANTVGNLPFIVDKEADNKKISEIEANLSGVANASVVNVTVDGRDITFTKGDNTTIKIKTQDTNTDSKVLNTPNLTTKAFVTGTTNTTGSAHIGQQIYDPNIFIGSTAGELNATTFKGTATKATADASGNTITSTYETKSAARSKLSEAKSYADSKCSEAKVYADTQNKEAYLGWGGKNHSGTFGPIDAALVPELGADRLAFFPVDNITLMYSTNGSNWSVLNSEDTKKALFRTGGEFYIGNSSSKGIDKTNYMCRVILNTTDALYTALNKFIILSSTEGSTGCYCTIDARTKANADANVNTWITFANKVPLSGLSGYNVINTNSLTTHGNQTSQYSQIRFTFGVTSHAASVNSPGFCVMRIMGFGGVGWTTPSKLAKNGHLYSYDKNGNATFPAQLSAGQFKGNLVGNVTGSADHSDYADEANYASTAGTAVNATHDSEGQVISTTYATKTALNGLKTSLQSMITMGTADPNSSTGGKIYFKYLE